MLSNLKFLERKSDGPKGSQKEIIYSQLLILLLRDGSVKEKSKSERREDIISFAPPLSLHTRLILYLRHELL